MGIERIREKCAAEELPMQTSLDARRVCLVLLRPLTLGFLLGVSYSVWGF